MIDLSTRRQFTQPLTYRIVGFGGAGLQVLDRLLQAGAAPALLVAADTDRRLLEGAKAGERILLGCVSTGGLGTGGDPEVGRASLEENRSELHRAVEGNQLVILLGGLGGGTASGALAAAAREAKEAGAMVMAAVTLPFTFEGKRRLAQADAALAELEQAVDLLLCFENDRMGEGVSPSAGIGEAFTEADRVMAGSVSAVLDLLEGTGLIHLGYADLKAALPGLRARTLFGFGIAEGSNRPFDALARALRNPLMDKGRMLEECDAVLAQVTGGPEMTLHEVELLMEELQRHVGEGTQVIFGASASSRMAGWMSLTLLASARLPSVEPESVVAFAPPQAQELTVFAEEEQAEDLEELAPMEAAVSHPVETPAMAFVEEEAITEEPQEPEQEQVPEEEPAKRENQGRRKPREERPEDGNELFSMLEVRIGRQSEEPSEELEEEPQAAEEPEAEAPEPEVNAAEVAVTPEPQHAEPQNDPAPSARKVPTQGTLKFEPIARGRFEKSEPTIVDGQDLDIPTYLRRNIRIRLRN